MLVGGGGGGGGSGSGCGGRMVWDGYKVCEAERPRGVLYVPLPVDQYTPAYESGVHGMASATAHTHKSGKLFHIICKNFRNIIDISLQIQHLVSLCNDLYYPIISIFVAKYLCPHGFFLLNTSVHMASCY